VVESGKGTTVTSVVVNGGKVAVSVGVWILLADDASDDVESVKLDESVIVEEVVASVVSEVVLSVVGEAVWSSVVSPRM
jgi:hypothetical protein